MAAELATHPGYRFPAGVIHHAVWLYHLFSLSLRDIELILAERAFWSATKASVAGAFASVRSSQQGCASGDRSRATRGTLMRCT